MCFLQSFCQSFADTFKSFFELTNEFPNITKLAILLISGESGLQYLEKSSKKVKKPKWSVNLSLTSSLMTCSPDNFCNFFLFNLMIFFIFLSKWINYFTNHSLKFSLSVFFSNSYNSSQNIFSTLNILSHIPTHNASKGFSLYFVPSLSRTLSICHFPIL